MTAAELAVSADAVLQAYRRLVARRVLILAGLLVLCVAAFLLDLVTGPSSLTPLQVLAGVFSPDALSAPQQAIIWQVRVGCRMIGCCTIGEHC